MGGLALGDAIGVVDSTGGCWAGSSRTPCPPPRSVGIFFCWRRGGRDLTGRPVAAPPRLVRHRRRPAAVDPWPCTQPQAGADQGNEINRHDLLSCWLPYGKACEGVSLVVPHSRSGAGLMDVADDVPPSGSPVQLLLRHLS